jgi:hypothetical protein
LPARKTAFTVIVHRQPLQPDLIRARVSRRRERDARKRAHADGVVREIAWSR